MFDKELFMLNKACLDIPADEYYNEANEEYVAYNVTRNSYSLYDPRVASPSYSNTTELYYRSKGSIYLRQVQPSKDYHLGALGLMKVTYTDGYTYKSLSVAYNNINRDDIIYARHGSDYRELAYGASHVPILNVDRTSFVTDNGRIISYKSTPHPHGTPPSVTTIYSNVWELEFLGNKQELNIFKHYDFVARNKLDSSSSNTQHYGNGSTYIRWGDNLGFTDTEDFEYGKWGAYLHTGNFVYWYSMSMRFGKYRVSNRLDWVDTGNKVIVPYYIFNRFPYRIDNLSQYNTEEFVFTKPEQIVYLNEPESSKDGVSGGMPMPSIDRTPTGQLVDLYIYYNKFGITSDTNTVSDTLHLKINCVTRESHFQYKGNNTDSSSFRLYHTSGEIEGPTKTFADLPEGNLTLMKDFLKESP
jgi:hypothetical protein